MSDLGQEGNTQRGIDALKAGNNERARQLLAAAILENRDDARAWLWLSGAVETDAERAACLHQVLRIDPLNKAAVQGLAVLEEQHEANNGDEPALPSEAMPTLRAGSVPSPAVNNAPTNRVWTKAVPEPPGNTLPGATLRDKAPAASAAQTPTAIWPERILFRARPSLIKPVIGGLVFLLFFFAAAVVLSGRPALVFLVLLPAALVSLKFVLQQLFERQSEVYTLTSGHLVIEGGMFRAQRRMIDLNEIQRIACQRTNLFSRLIGASDLLLYARDGRVLARLRDLRRCSKYLDQISNAAGLVVVKANGHS